MPQDIIAQLEAESNEIARAGCRGFGSLCLIVICLSHLLIYSPLDYPWAAYLGCKLEVFSLILV